MIAVSGAFLAFASVAAFVYAFLWPTVSARVGLFITFGSVFGTVIALGTLFWAATPLVGIGISRARLNEQSDTLWSLLGPRLLIGAAIEICAVGLVLFLLARWLRQR
jgi:hypothetical protein